MIDTRSTSLAQCQMLTSHTWPMATLSDGAGIEKSLSETSPLLDPEMVHFPVALQTHTSGNNGQGLPWSSCLMVPVCVDSFRADQGGKQLEVIAGWGGSWTAGGVGSQSAPYRTYS